MAYLAFWLGSSTISKFEQKNEIRFSIHDAEHSAKTEDFPPETTLNTYLREIAKLKGTKYMCLEGGCGTCIVVVSYLDPVTKHNTIIAVNSCLVLLYSCAGWKIYTSDGIGEPKAGYHPVQKALVQFNGTQCGYCSSGMIMSMYALYESKTDFTMEDVENSFGGNLCRCTGYRPILTAFKSLAQDSNTEVLGSSDDIEDIKVCKKNKLCKLECKRPQLENPQPYFYISRKCKWYKAYSINEVLDIIKSSPNQQYMLVGGNTATGVYRRSPFIDVFIDITGVLKLVDHSLVKNTLVLGANMTFTKTILVFNRLSISHSKLSYLKKVASHMEKIANPPVRNTGTLAGNLFIKYHHHEFPSDLYVLLDGIGAKLTLIDIYQKETTVSMKQFLKMTMENTIMKSITLPFLDDSYKFGSFKVMPRTENAHALENACFLVQLEESGKVKLARLVYGNIGPEFSHASSTEAHLIGKDLFDNETLRSTFQVLVNEISPNQTLANPSSNFRKGLAISLFYKFVLSVAPGNKVSPDNVSGGIQRARPVSFGTQEYGTNKSLYPLTQPISKLEALSQCNGTAQYVMDIPDQPNQLHAVFVLTKAPPYSVITKTDASAGLKLEGVKAYFDKDDIPGSNNIIPPEPNSPVINEELFCSGTVKFYHQPVGVMVATSREIAQRAAELVKITYAPNEKIPLLTIRDILKNGDQNKIKPEGKFDSNPTDWLWYSSKTVGKHVFEGEFNTGGQYHFHTENQCCAVIPQEDGLDVFPSSQGLGFSQFSISHVLNYPSNKINVVVRRVGGSFGGKISRNGFVSGAAALAAFKLQKPVKMSLPLETNMRIMGKRSPFLCKYEVGVDDDGTIQHLHAKLYTDLGNSGGMENASEIMLKTFVGFYNTKNWKVEMFSTKSDTPTAAFCRAPGRTETVGALESIMEHIALTLNLDPITVRLKNAQNKEIKKYLDELIEWAEIRKRQIKIEEFNKKNRWVKQGLATVANCYPTEDFAGWHCHISIFHKDGTVAVMHGGSEVGQGINTKVAQVCAYALEIPLSLITVKPSQVIFCPNNFFTGASIASERVCYAVLEACKTLKERMKPIRDTMKSPVRWEDLVRQCYLKQVDLYASHMFHSGSPGIKPYTVYGSACAEVEVDILTGTTQITRVDIIEDTGDSTSPNIDIGQVEGAFIMGVGYWTSEQLVYNKDGQLLTDRTWTYKPPGAKDIPIDFRVKFPKNNPNFSGVLGSKTAAEPPLCLSVAVPLAIRHAIAAARRDADQKAKLWVPFDGPTTVEATFLNCLNDYTQYKL